MAVSVLPLLSTFAISQARAASSCGHCLEHRSRHRWQRFLSPRLLGEREGLVPGAAGPLTPRGGGVGVGVGGLPPPLPPPHPALPPPGGKEKNIPPGRRRKFAGK